MTCAQELYNYFAVANLKEALRKASDRETQKMIVSAYRRACDVLEEHFGLNRPEAKLPPKAASPKTEPKPKAKPKHTRAEIAFFKVAAAVRRASSANYETRAKKWPSVDMPRGWKLLVKKDCPHGYSEWWIDGKGHKAVLRFRKLYGSYGVQATLLEKGKDNG